MLGLNLNTGIKFTCTLALDLFIFLKKKHSVAKIYTSSFFQRYLYTLLIQVYKYTVYADFKT